LEEREMAEFEGFKKGINLGGWISQFDKYDKVHFDTFITEEDIARIADMGFDHVRVPVDYNVLQDEEGNLIESGFDYLLNCRQWCENHGLNMLIDLHECYGYSFDPLKKGMDRRKFFYDDALQERFMNLWREIATRFASYENQVAFEPLNEVVLEDVSDA
jgi:aryl-phospho-beta-D-glucosidase BglC (GH1 family)